MEGHSNALTSRKASFSGADGGSGNCIEVGQAGDGTVLVLDTKDRAGTSRFTGTPPAEWRAFVAGVHNGELDLDRSGRLP
jgi:hypothetical protein